MWSVGKLNVKFVSKSDWFSKYVYVSTDQIYCSYDSTWRTVFCYIV